MAYDLSVEPLATDLDELHRMFSVPEIIRRVRERLRVPDEARDPAAFRTAFQVAFESYKDGTSDTESEALKAYTEFLASDDPRVPFKVARCLLPFSTHQ